jgi:kinesin family protein 6/9
MAEEQQTIRIFCRIRPTKSKTGLYELQNEEQGTSAPLITFYMPKSEADGLVNNRRESYPFRFNRVFDQQTTQDEVFEQVAKEVIDKSVDLIRAHLCYTTSDKHTEQ